VQSAQIGYFFSTRCWDGSFHGSFADRAASRMRANGCGGLAEKVAEKKCLHISPLRHTATADSTRTIRNIYATVRCQPNPFQPIQTHASQQSLFMPAPLFMPAER
jgi:hypothetical protein